MVAIPRTDDFTAQAAEGCVLLDGPGIVCSLHPDAARGVAALLTDAADQASEQRATAKKPGSIKRT